MPTSTEKQIEYRSRPFEIRQVGENNDGTFKGEANTFFAIDTYGTIFDPKAFDLTIEGFLADGYITYAHDIRCPIGKPLVARPKGGKLYVEGEIYGDMWDGSSVLAGMRRGVIKEMSIGFYPEEFRDLTRDELTKYWQENGYTPTELDLMRGQMGARVFTRVTLEEVAICVRGSNPGTRLTGVRSMLRNLFGLGKRSEPPMPEEKPAEEPADSEDTVDEAEIDAIVARFVPALKSVVTEMAKERKAGKTQDEPTTPPEDAKPPEDDGMDEEEARSALLLAEHLLMDIEVEAALKEGRS